MVTKHPTQPIEVDDGGVVRFKRNKVVEFMLDHPDKADLNTLSFQVQLGQLPEADYMQLMQLIGYSVSGYGDLAEGGSKAWRKHAEKMDAKAAALWEAWKASEGDD